MDNANGDDALDKLFAAEDAAIKDDGFSSRVIEAVGRRRMVRRVTIAGASLVGGMVTALSLSGLTPLARTLTSLFSQVDGAVTEAVKAPALIGPEIAASMGGAPMIAIVAGLVAVSVCLAAATLQER